MRGSAGKSAASDMLQNSTALNVLKGKGLLLSAQGQLDY